MHELVHVYILCMFALNSLYEHIMYVFATRHVRTYITSKYTYLRIIIIMYNIYICKRKVMKMSGLPKLWLTGRLRERYIHMYILYIHIL